MGKLIKDWFNRRAEDAYTFADDSKRLFNWDKNRESYSSYFVKDKDGLQNAAQMIGSIFSVMNVPKNIKYVSKVQKDHTLLEDPTVHVPLKMLQDEKGNYMTHDGKLLDAFYGLSIQNAALASMQTESEYKQTLKLRDTDSGVTVKNMLFSVLNTERIDQKLANRFPGYLKFVQAFKNRQYDNSDFSEESYGEESKQKRLMKLLVKLLRYPADISEADMEEFKEPIAQIERLLKRHGGIPDSFNGCKSMSNSLAQIVYKYVEEEEKEPEGGSDESEEPGEESGEGAPPKSKGTPRGELDDFAKDMMKQLLEPEEKAKDSAKDAEDFEDFVEDMEKGDSADIDYDKEGKAYKQKVVFTSASSSKESYEEVLKEIEVSKAAVLKKLFQRRSKDQTFVVKSMRTGRLDTNKIAEAKQGVDTIYEKMGHITTNKICVGVLIDESGSMSGNKKIEKAQQAAVFINEVFKNMPDVELFIYGHTADEDRKNQTHVRVYREPGAKDRWALGSVEARYNNRDGDAILASARRIRNHTKNQGILFVISDGQPAARDYSGHKAIVDTRKKVTDAQALGFQVIQIAIESSVPSAEMFDYYIKMTDIKNLPRDLANYMSRKIDKLIKEKVSL